MDTIYITGIFVTTLSAWVALVRLPAWCFRSIHRHRLWEERDAIADEILRGALKKDHEAVRDLLAAAEHSAKATHRLTVLDLFAWQAIHRRCDRTKLNVLSVSDAGLSERELALVRAHRERIVQLSVRSMLVGSWAGILTIFVRLVPAIAIEIRESHKRRRNVTDSLRHTLVVATDEASNSSMGRAAREFINIEDGILSKGHAALGREPVSA